MFLASEHLKQQAKDNLVPSLMGSSIAIGALKRGEAHVAGVHLVDERSGAWNLPYLDRNLKGMDCLVVTFAHWQEGLIVRQGNPKKIRGVQDLARPGSKSSTEKTALERGGCSIGNWRAVAFSRPRSKGMTTRFSLTWRLPRELKPVWRTPESGSRRPPLSAVSISSLCNASVTTWLFPKPIMIPFRV